MDRQGRPGAAPKFHRADFTTATDAELLDDLFHPNLTVRFLAGHQLRRREAEGRQFPNDGSGLAKLVTNPDRAASVLGWGASIVEAGKQPVTANNYAMFVNYAKDKKNAVKPEHLTGHLVRALAGKPKWEKEERAVLLDVFKSFDSPHQTRAAVEAAGLHPHADFVGPLVAVLKKCPADDTLLRQAARIALRNCLRDADAWPSEYDTAYADVALAIPNRKAAGYLLAQISAQRFRRTR